MPSQIPRPEHPAPQFRRDRWRNLNGIWDFAFDQTNSGFERGWVTGFPAGEHITVPFCPESRLSGVHFTDFILSCWYHRSFDITSEDLEGDVLLHFGAVDYEARVYVNGVEAGCHRGGYASFVLDVTRLVHAGTNELVVHAVDDVRSHRQPAGKQSDRFESYECSYTRTTGIWQTVWLEFVPKQRVVSVVYKPNVPAGRVAIEARIRGAGYLTATVSFEGEQCAEATVHGGGTVVLDMPLTDIHLWRPGLGNLYDVTLRFVSSDGMIDAVHSYFGLRDVRVEGKRVLINGEPVFQRLILDQGFYPEGIYTAPDAEQLERDIVLSMQAGFNGARLHQKAFEPLYLYYCDKHGYLAWGEMADWQLDISSAESMSAFLPEWVEIVERDRNHPAIVGWCPFNETWDFQGRRQYDPLLTVTHRITKALDPDRPCIDVSGMFHTRETDIYDLHDYEQDPACFAERYARYGEPGHDNEDRFPDRQRYPGNIPFFVSEYGGIKIDSAARADGQSWGYGKSASGEEEFFSRYEALTGVLMSNPNIFGFCYTQLTDVEQECNGIYSYDRKAKIDIDRLRAINSRPAAYESVSDSEGQTPES